MPGRRPDVVKSARRVVEVFEYFDRDRRAATVTDISRALSYPQSSTSELLRSLTELGYLYHNRIRRTYSPTARVALLGAWVEPRLFRGGRAFAAVDRIAEKTGETVVISSGGRAYLCHSIHVVQGANEGAVPVHVGQSQPLLHCPEGELLVASYPDRGIQSALHHIHFFERAPEREFIPSQKLVELQALRQRGWKIAPTGHGPNCGAVALLLPRRRGGNRLVLSVRGQRNVIQQRGEDILGVMLEERDALAEDVGEAAHRPSVQRSRNGATPPSC